MEELQYIVSFCHDLGYSVMAHCSGRENIRNVITAGCDSIEHGYYMDDTCRELLLETGAVWVPTLATCGNLRGCGRFNEDAVTRITDCHMENVRLALEKGIHIAAGSDAGAYLVPHGKGLYDEVDLLKEACQGQPDLLEKLEQSLTCSQQIIKQKFRR